MKTMMPLDIVDFYVFVRLANAVAVFFSSFPFHIHAQDLEP